MCMPNFKSIAQKFGWTYFWNVISRQAPSGVAKKRTWLSRKNERSEKDEIRRGKSLRAQRRTCAKKSNKNQCICIKLGFAMLPLIHIIEVPPEVHFT